MSDTKNPFDVKQTNGFSTKDDTISHDEWLARKMQDEEDAKNDELLAKRMQDEWNRDAKPDYNGDHKTSHQTDYKAPFTSPPGANHTGPKSAYDPSATPVKRDLAAPTKRDSPQHNHSHKNDLPAYTNNNVQHPPHHNAVTLAGDARAVTEQKMQFWLQELQFKYRIYNSELEPEHESDYPCSCELHRYQAAKWSRADIQDRWNAAVIYPGEKSYNGNRPYQSGLFSGNPYYYKVISPYGPLAQYGIVKFPNARLHATFISQTIALNNSLNREAQAAIDAKEPKVTIWDADDNTPPPIPTEPEHKSKMSKMFGIKSSEERQAKKTDKEKGRGRELRDKILREEAGRWPDAQWRDLVKMYQEKVGMSKKIAELRVRQPIQYFHLLQAGYFEPIPVAWANQASNPLKFSIEASAGWRGITPSWRGFEDTAEERLYWVLNHREGSVGTRLKPDFISALDLARQRMASAVPPPPEYFDKGDVCHTQHITDGYSLQVRPAPFRAFDRPENASDDTMILLDVSGSMDFTPQAPNYDRYLITGYRRSTQPKNKGEIQSELTNVDVAKAIIRRFTDAMINHDRDGAGYDLTTFSSSSTYIGQVNHHNLDELWDNIKIGGGTRVMTGWQKVKDLHFRKHSESAIHHPVYGWQAGPQTPILRLLLLLDGEATDMDEFELDLLGLSWAHVTIFLIGVDGCPHHHRHANELQRISDVNHHVSFVDAQGNTPERYVTHELLKRHLGYDISMQEFQELEVPPPYEPVA